MKRYKRITVKEGERESKTYEGALADNHNQKTGGNTEGLLGTRHGGVDVPVVETEFFSEEGADSIHGNESVGTDTTDGGGDSLDVVENTGGGIDLGERHELVLLTAEGLFNFLDRNGVSDRRSMDVIHIHRVSLETVDGREER